MEKSRLGLDKHWETAVSVQIYASFQTLFAKVQKSKFGLPLCLSIVVAHRWPNVALQAIGKLVKRFSFCSCKAACLLLRTCVIANAWVRGATPFDAKTIKILRSRNNILHFWSRCFVNITAV